MNRGATPQVRTESYAAAPTLEDLRRKPTIYPLPEWETEREALEYLACVSNEIFEEQLDGCCRVPAVWPEDLKLHTFLRWFECGFHPVVVDVCDNRAGGQIRDALRNGRFSS